MNRFRFVPVATAVVFLIIGSFAIPAAAQEAAPPALRAGTGAETINMDGLVNEPAWQMADMVDAFTQIDPQQGIPATYRTEVRVITSRNSLIIGIVCEDAEPNKIVSFSVRRDASLTQEDYLRIVLGPFHDGRTGYVFSINPSGARFDSVITVAGDSENNEWDGIWEAATSRNEKGWSAEIRIPTQSLSFKPDLHEWHFNVERHIQRLLETDRWTAALRQYRVTQTSHAGSLTNLPDFALGRGLRLTPSVTSGGGIPSAGASATGEFQPSFDLTKRIGANVNASLTMNTDFAETEVDTRQTNLTRFPLFYPEKRAFFLEDVDIFQFGPNVNTDMIPYFSRKMGLVNGREVPIIAGGKVNGRVGRSNFAGVVVRTDSKPGVVSEQTSLGAVRWKQNLFKESYVGFVATAGDPLGRTGSWLTGVDFTYLTTRFLGNKNFSINFWGAATGRDGLTGDRVSYAAKIDYPNDVWDLRLWYKRIGRDFDPSLGFVPRRAMQRWNPSLSHRMRFKKGKLQELSVGVNPYITTNLNGKWETYDSTINVATARFRSGDGLSFNLLSRGDRPTTPFRVATGVTIAPGSYEWLLRSVGFTTARKRRLYSSFTWTSGTFYNGDLDTLDASAVWNPTPLFTVELNGQRNVGDLPAGRFTQNLMGARLRINLSPDLSISSYSQYDTASDSVGINSRLQWTFLPVADLFVVYNHNIKSLLDRWELDSNQLLIKLRYAWQM